MNIRFNNLLMMTGTYKFRFYYVDETGVEDEGFCAAESEEDVIQKLSVIGFAPTRVESIDIDYKPKKKRPRQSHSTKSSS